MAHRTLRVALGEAVNRRHVVENVAKIAKPPKVEEDEIVPFTVEEARRILDTAANVRNGARFVVALTLGLWRGEALGLKWSDLNITWRHGCEKNSECRGGAAQLCPGRQLKSATMTIRRAVQQFVWQHGCPDSSDGPACGRKYGAHCPKRHGGGVVTIDVKSRARGQLVARGRMGWSDASIAKRYMHVPADFLASIADQVGGLAWADPDGDEEDDDPSASMPASV